MRGRIQILKYKLNALADELAVDYNTRWRLRPTSPPLISPLSEVEVLYKNSIITSRLPSLIKTARHKEDLKTNILQQKQSGISLPLIR